jgi:hypothetical protein
MSSPKHEPRQGAIDVSELAALARSSLQHATVAVLSTYPCSTAARPHLSQVAVQAGGDGNPVLRLLPDSLAVVQLTAWPMATIHVAPPGCEPLTLHGQVHRLPGSDDAGRLTFILEPAVVHLRTPADVVDPSQYARSGCDAVANQAPRVLAHLRQRHVHQLLSCLHAQGVHAQFAEPVHLDRHGLTVLAVCEDGVSEVSMPFPRPVSRLEELPPGLSLMLLCNCS